MNYEQFRTAWYEALTEAGMWSHLAPPTEAVDLGSMSRTYQVYVYTGHSQEIEPFHVSASLSWTWDALQAARTATTEKDTLMQFLGEEGRHQDTERPGLRVDVTLSATLPKKVKRRVAAYKGEKDLWYFRWFRSTLAHIEVRPVRWGDMIRDQNAGCGISKFIRAFYERGIQFDST